MGKVVEIMDIVIVFTLTIVCMSLITIMLFKMEQDEISYIDDKTIYDLSTIEEKQLKDTIGQVPVNEAQAYLLLAIQDDYCPYIGNIVMGSSPSVTVEFTDGYKWYTNRLTHYVSSGVWKKNAITHASNEFYMTFKSTGGKADGTYWWSIY